MNSTTTIIITVRSSPSVEPTPSLPPVTSSAPPTSSIIVVPESPSVSPSVSKVTQVIIPSTNSPILPVTSSIPSTTSRNIVSSIFVSSVTVGSNTATNGMSNTMFSTPSTTKAESSPNESGASPVLVTTVSVVVGGILLALLAAWIIHTLIKSRREKKENDRLAADEDLDGMFQAPVMGSISNGRSMYDHNDSFWNQKNQDNRVSVVSVDSVDFARQSPEIEGQFVSSGGQDSQEYGIPESLLQVNSKADAVAGSVSDAAVTGAAVTGVALARAEVSETASLGSSSVGNFVRVISDYSAVRPDELNMRQGQILLMEQSFQDGWAYGKNITTQERGMFPFNFVVSVDPSIFQR